jgi:hypothetical protein
MSALTQDLINVWEHPEQYHVDLARMALAAEVSPRARWHRAVEARLAAATGAERVQLQQLLAHVADVEHRALRGGLDLVELWESASLGGRLPSYAALAGHRATRDRLPSIEDYGGDVRAFRTALLNRMTGQC